LPKLECIVIINLPSCYGGANLWPDTDRPMSLLDKKFEVIGISGAGHLGQCQTGIAHPIVLGQGSELKITTDQQYPMQIDGEPCEQGASVFHITFHNQVRMLVNTQDCHKIVKKDIRKSSLQ